jgi:hypothetical protein
MQKGGQAGVVDAGAEVLGVLPDGIEGVDQGGDQLEEVFRASVGECLLGKLPNSFIWIEFGSVAWKAHEMKATDTLDKLGDQASAVGTATVPKDEYVTT